jgi:AraC-like DNA-binding protein
MIEGYKEIFNAQNPSFLSGQEFALITTPNCLMTEKKAFPEVNYQSILLFFSHEILEEFRLKYQDLIEESMVAEYKEIEVFKYDNYSVNFRTSLKLMISNKDLTNQELLQAKFNEIMLYLLKHNPKKVYPILSKRINNVEVRFKRTIENNLFSNLDLEELAFLSNMSLSTFKRYFKKYYHCSPQKYLQLKRLEFAKYLLEKGERPNDIYQKSGYQSLSNFIKAYKAQYGHTPGEASII